MDAIRVLGLVGVLALAAPFAAQAEGPARGAPTPQAVASTYLIGPGDTLQIFVWKNPDLSTEVPVRPDGRITTPLIQDMQAQGKTPTELAGDLRTSLANYIQDPNVTVVVKTFAAPNNSAAVRVIGAAVTPKTISYRSGLTVLDVMIDVGGLTTFASGNRAVLIRKEDGVYKTHALHLADLVKSGDMKANMAVMPGDVIRIPERWF